MFLIARIESPPLLRKMMIILTEKKPSKKIKIKLSNGFEIPKEIDINILEEENAKRKPL